MRYARRNRSTAESLRLLLITDGSAADGAEALATKIRAALRGGASAVMVREKNAPTRDLCDFTIQLREVTKRFGALLIVNDRVDVALTAGADGVHLGWKSMPVAQARSLLGPSRLIGVSTHSLEEARAAWKERADYVTFGPVFPTPSKEGLVDVQGLEGLREIAREKPPVPLVALGGIGPENARETIEAGANGVALIRAVLDAEDPEAAARVIAGRIGIDASR